MGTLLYSFQLSGSPKFNGQFGALIIDYMFLPNNPTTLRAMFFTVTTGAPSYP
jgi:hypothetical protein